MIRSYQWSIYKKAWYLIYRFVYRLKNILTIVINNPWKHFFRQIQVKLACCNFYVDRELFIYRRTQFSRTASCKCSLQPKQYGMISTRTFLSRTKSTFMKHVVIDRRIVKVGDIISLISRKTGPRWKGNSDWFLERSTFWTYMDRLDGPITN